MSRYGMISLTVDFVCETEKAICVEFGDVPFREKVWLPKSQIKWPPEAAEEGDELEVEIPRWLAEDKEMIQ